MAMTDLQAKFIGIAATRSFAREHGQKYPHQGGIGEVKVPGTFYMCCTCANHGVRGAIGKLYYCSRSTEAETIVQPTSMEIAGVVHEACHWYQPGGTSKLTPHSDGRAQVLNPDWEGPAA